MHSPAGSGLILTLLVMCIADFAHAFSIETVALTGQPAPGTPDEIVFDFFEEPTVNALGRVAFRAGVPDGSEGVFLAVPDRERTPIPASTAWSYALLIVLLVAVLLRKNSQLHRSLDKN